jgi:hypothetical protein
VCRAVVITNLATSNTDAIKITDKAAPANNWLRPQTEKYAAHPATEKPLLKLRI